MAKEEIRKLTEEETEMITGGAENVPAEIKGGTKPAGSTVVAKQNVTYDLSNENALGVYNTMYTDSKNKNYAE